MCMANMAAIRSEKGPELLLKIPAMMIYLVPIFLQVRKMHKRKQMNLKMITTITGRMNPYKTKLPGICSIGFFYAKTLKIQ